MVSWIIAVISSLGTRHSSQASARARIDNRKPNFAYLVADLAELAVARYGASGVLTHTKILGSSVPADEAVYRDFGERCDIVITGSGD